MSEESRAEILQFRAILSEAYAAVLSDEVNKAIVEVRMTDLINEQIARNGTSGSTQSSTETANSSPPPVSDKYIPGNFYSGTEASNLTKMDRLTKLKNALSDTIKAVTELDPTEVASEEDYQEAADDTVSFIQSDGGVITS